MGLIQCCGYPTTGNSMLSRSGRQYQGENKQHTRRLKPGQSDLYFDRFPHPNSDVPYCNSENQVEEQHSCDQGSTGCRGHESKYPKFDGHNCHTKHLHPITYRDTEQQWVDWSPEYVPDNKFQS